MTSSRSLKSEQSRSIRKLKECIIGGYNQVYATTTRHDDGATMYRFFNWYESSPSPLY